MFLSKIFKWTSKKYHPSKDSENDETDIFSIKCKVIKFKNTINILNSGLFIICS